jgi:hypothetical protein
MVPFADYKGQYELPEVICFNAIPLERLKVAQVFESHTDLVNTLRAKAGRPLKPVPKPVDPKRSLDIFDR